MAIFNYTDENENVLFPNWYWGPYKVICEEINRNIENYELFNEEVNFNFNSFKNKFLELTKKQDRIFTILNTAAHNPTGYIITDYEWDNIFLKKWKL